MNTQPQTIIISSALNTPLTATEQDDLDRPLTPTEQADLDSHLSIIKTSFITMIKSLAYIHINRLYRGDGSRKWAQFCKDELNISPRYGYYYIEAFSVLNEIEAHNTQTHEPLPTPTRLEQTRALAQSDLIVTTWQNATRRFGDNPTGKQIRQAIEADVTTEQALIMRGVTDTAVISALANLAQKSDNGYQVVTELMTTGYLQLGDSEDAIPLADVRLADLRRYEDDMRREAIARRVANEGGVVITVFPNNPQKTARALLAHMTTSQAYELSILLDEGLEQNRTPD